MPSLFIDPKRESDPVVRVRWSLSQKEVEELKERKAENIHLVISITFNGREVDRRLVRFDDGMTYISFHRKGIHTLNTFLVFQSEHSEDKDLAGQIIWRHGIKMMFGSAPRPGYHIYDYNNQLDPIALAGFRVRFILITCSERILWM